MTMTMQAIIPSTDDVLAAMLTENTGRHMLDSGGAYGRNFERNAGRTVEDFRDAPAVSIVTGRRYSGGKWTDDTVVDWATLDVFHFIRERAEYAPEVDAAFHAFALAPEREREPWFACLDEWLEAIGADDVMTVNTYNGEDSLSQVIQYAAFTHPDDGEVYAAIAIHGGCDVRGGYTAPRVFLIGDSYTLMDNADMEVYMSEPEDVVPDPAVEPPLPMDVPARYPRSVSITIRGGYGDRYTDDDVADDVDFHFGETPVEVADDGTITITDGPAKGWTVAFDPPYPCC